MENLKHINDLNSHESCCLIIDELTDIHNELNIRLKLAEIREINEEDIRKIENEKNDKLKKLLLDSKPIDVPKNPTIYNIKFESYIMYTTVNESYYSANEENSVAIVEGNLSIFEKSNYLDCVKTLTFANEDHPGPFKHYSLYTSNHIVHIISCLDPLIDVTSK